MKTAYDWSGPYVGAHVGAGWQNVTFSDPSAMFLLGNCCIYLGALGDPSAATNGNGSGFLAGGQAGWAYQVEHLVIGGEVDMSGTDIKGGGSSSWPATVPGGSYANENYSARTNWTATSTASVGIAHDAWLFYGKSGAAWADNSYGLAVSGAGYTGAGPFSFNSSTDQIVLGWTVGVGVKWALTSNLFLNAEYDYLDFGSRAQHMSGSLVPALTQIPTGQRFSPSANFDPMINQAISELKVGLNYKFSPGGPLGSIVPAPGTRIAYDWSGFYVGGHVGGGWQTTGFSDPGAQAIIVNCCVLLTGANLPTAASDANGAGVIGGAQAGWMYQIDRVVVGADVDFSGANMRGSGASTATAVPTSTVSYTESYNVQTRWTATSTATVGVTRDMLLFYGKAGAAFADNAYGLGVSGIGANYSPTQTFSFASSTDRISVGWTGGIGVKWALSDKLFVNAEYDLSDFGSATQSFSGNFNAIPAAYPPGYSHAATFEPVFNQVISEVKVGLNYKFTSALPF
jgi:outer membrane immunogenic protein